MDIKTKYDIGDKVKVKCTATWAEGKHYTMEIRGIVIYDKNSICYFEEYEEDSILEENIIEKLEGEQDGESTSIEE